MNTTVVALLAGLLSAAGVVAIVAGLWPTDPTGQPTRPDTDWAGLGRRAGILAAIAAGGAVAWVVTGWPVAALGVVVATLVVPSAVATARAQRREREVLDATRMWLLQLRTTLQAGVGLEAALRETAHQVRADSPLAVPLARLVDRLEWMPPAGALDRLAVDLDNHVADTAVTVLGSAMANSQQGVAAALESLGVWANEDLAHMRRVEAEARGLRLARRIVLAIWAGLAVYLAVSSPDLMAPYATFQGQATLALLGLFAAGAVWLLGRWSVVSRPERFFAHTHDRAGGGR